MEMQDFKEPILADLRNLQFEKAQLEKVRTYTYTIQCRSGNFCVLKFHVKKFVIGDDYALLLLYVQLFCQFDFCRLHQP